jgi:hypothetical protein
MAGTASLFVSLVLLVATEKREKNAVLVAGTQQNLSSLFLDIYSKTSTKARTYFGSLELQPWTIDN